MRGAFVVQIDKASQPAQKQFQGWVEEVDSGEQLRFHSTDELLAFLARRMQVMGWGEHGQENDRETSTASIVSNGQEEL